MNRFLLIQISCLCLTTTISAQSNKLIKELESKRGALQQQIAETESLLKNTKKDVGSQLNGLAVLTGQIEERKRYIIAINNITLWSYTNHASIANNCNLIASSTLLEYNSNSNFAEFICHIYTLICSKHSNSK